MTYKPKNKRLMQIVSIFLGVLLTFFSSVWTLLSLLWFEPEPGNSFIKDLFLSLLTCKGHTFQVDSFSLH